MKLQDKTLEHYHHENWFYTKVCLIIIFFHQFIYCDSQYYFSKLVNQIFCLSCILDAWKIYNALFIHEWILTDKWNQIVWAQSFKFLVWYFIQIDYELIFIESWYWINSIFFGNSFGNKQFCSTAKKNLMKYWTKYDLNFSYRNHDSNVRIPLNH
jgi:hypothetical protein